jgi:hypothetical protein
MDYITVRSSNLIEVGYEPATSILAVRFKNGTEYQYSNVPEHLYRGLISASSPGSYLHKFIKDAGFSCVQVR